MDKITFLLLAVVLGTGLVSAQEKEVLLKDFEPVSIYNVPKTKIEKAKYPVVDFHAHPYAKSEQELEEWSKTMDKFGVEKSIILTYATGEAFDSIYKIYSKYGDRFELWCGFDYSGHNEKRWPEKAVKELERCFEVGAKGVGELGDKGKGLFYSKPSPGLGMHIDDKRMQPLLRRCGELGMPISVHVADPYWMYLPIDRHNDGLMNAAQWKIDVAQEGLLTHEELIGTLENAVKNNPQTTFIACHLANSSHNLDILGKLFDHYPNIYADIAARYAEIAPVPRRTKSFFEKYQDRLVYGTDMGLEPSVYATTFRILETADEHFYDKEYFTYHWPLHGLDLSDKTLQKLYNGNSKRILK